MIVIENDVLLTRKETAGEMGVVTRTVDRYRKLGFIQTVPHGVKRIMISGKSVKAFLDECAKKRSA